MLKNCQQGYNGHFCIKCDWNTHQQFTVTTDVRDLGDDATEEDDDDDDEEEGERSS